MEEMYCLQDMILVILRPCWTTEQQHGASVNAQFMIKLKTLSAQQRVFRGWLLSIWQQSPLRRICTDCLHRQRV